GVGFRARHSLPTRRSSDLERNGRKRGVRRSAAGSWEGQSGWGSPREARRRKREILVSQFWSSLCRGPLGCLAPSDSRESSDECEDWKSTRLNSSHVILSYA